MPPASMAMSATPISSPRVEEFSLAGSPDAAHEPHALLARLDPARQPCLLDSAGGAPARWSWLGFDPLAGSAPAADCDPYALRALCQRREARPGDEVPGPFAGGFLGALAYDQGVVGEPLELPPEPWGFPRAAGGLYVDFFVRDEERGQTYLVLSEEPGDGRAPVAERRRALLAELEREPELAPFRATAPARRCTSPAQHQQRIEDVRARIAAGDVYQVNLAHRFLAEAEGDPRALYARLRRANRAPYMGYLGFGAGALLSASPELLLEQDGDELRTRPIKGTAARSPDPELDAQRARELCASEKELAELGMIVDLERNDLGRVAAVGSVAVEAFPRLESYARVHHLVADVSARLAPGHDVFDALAALFPGGSITGAPKLAAMQLAAELEGEGRGFFTGALGYVDPRGSACFNILIRSLLWRPAPARGAHAGEVSFRVGGGITWASDARAEDDETLAKAASLLAALEERGA